MMKRFLMTCLTAVTIALGSTAAQSAPTVALYLAIDSSVSISSTEMGQQRASYSQALLDVFIADPTLYGRVAIGAGIFGGNFRQIFSTSTIDSFGELNALRSAIGAIPLTPTARGIDETSTAIGSAILTSANFLTAFENTLSGEDISLLIDVTTDGDNTIGTSPAVAAAAVTNGGGINAVNCLGIGPDANCGWVGSSGTNFGSASNFQTLEAALRTKLTQEVNPIPEPTTFSLTVFACAILGFVGYRRKSQYHRVRIMLSAAKYIRHAALNEGSFVSTSAKSAYRLE